MAKRRLFAAAVVGVLLFGALVPRSARAQPKTSEAPPPSQHQEAPWERAPYQRRGGFVAGLSAGGMLASAAGFPNDPRKIGRQAYYTETGAGLGTSGSLWIGAALADWFTFGIGFAGGAFSANGDASGYGAFIFRVEAFPAWSLGGHWRDVGAMFEAGAGGATTTPSDDANTKLIDGGSASYIGAGAFYEGLRLWKVSSGPFAMADYMWSDSLRRPGMLVGWRAVLYTSP
jgi:hypothetical protein